MPINQSVYFFGNSLVNYAEGGGQTNAPFWMNRFAQFEDNSLAVEGGYGFLRNFADTREPNTDWGFDGVAEVYDSDNSSFAEAAFTSIIITPANFIQDRDPAATYFDGDRSPLEATRSVVETMQEVQPDARLFIYEGWADMGPFAPNFPPSEPQLDQYHAYNSGAYHDWYVELADTVSAQTGAEVTLIPVASVLSDILTREPLSQIDSEQLYVDSAPHGTETLYFLAGLVTYGALYGTMPPPDFAVDGVIDPVVAVHFGTITEQVAQSLGNYGFEVALSQGFDEETFDFVDLGDDVPEEGPAQQPPAETDDDVWIAPVEIEPGFAGPEDLAAEAQEPPSEPQVQMPEGEPQAQLPEGEPQITIRTIDAAADGTYLFDLTSDDPAYLFIDGDLVLINDGNSPDSPQQVVVELSQGEHTAEVRYFEQEGGEILILDMGPADSDGNPLPETTFEDIPEEEEPFDIEIF